MGQEYRQPENRAARGTRRPRRRSTSGASRDRWLVSYADFITLLFAFFATLYAASTVDAVKLSGVAVGLQQAFADIPKPMPGVLPAQAALVGPQVPNPRRDLERALGPELEQGHVQLTEDRRGLVLSIPEALAFPPGAAVMSPEAEQFIGRLSIALNGVPNAIRVEGHTDDVPIHNDRFGSNWELSTARATSVVSYLIHSGLSPERLSAAGYSEFHPRAENTSVEGRARNRRVDVVILNSDTRRSEEPAAGVAR